jgi:hypothetical protein
LCPEDFEQFNVTIVKGAGESIINRAIQGNEKIISGGPIDVIPKRQGYSKIIRQKDKKKIGL